MLVNSKYLNQIVTVQNSLALNGHAFVGLEKIYKSGRSLSVSLIFNGGLTQLMQSSVNYSIDNTSYSHNFSYFGNYAGLRFAYHFKAFKKKQIEK